MTSILVGRNTDDLEHPQLTVREWSGKNPQKIVLSQKKSTSSSQYPSPQSVLDHLYQEKKQSLIVEGGASTLQSFIDAGLWDEIRVETGSLLVDKGIKSPSITSEYTYNSYRTMGWQQDCNLSSRREISP